MYMNKDKSGREDFEVLNFEAASECIDFKSFSDWLHFAQAPLSKTLG